MHAADPTPRPLADLPLERLLEEREQLAKRWALSLMAAQPLERLEQIPIAELARRAPQLIELTLRCLASNEELERLASGESAAAADLARLTGAREHADALRALETLRVVLWEELLERLARPPAALIADLASRLSHVCSLLTIASVSEERGVRGGLPEVESDGQIAIRDERGAGPSAWINSIGRCLADHARDGEPFAVELIEVVGIERLRHAEPPLVLQRLVDEVGTALRGQLRPADTFTAESDGRYWLVAASTDGPSAMALAERLIAAVRSSVSHRNVPMEVAIGISICPSDGTEAAMLAAQADTKLYGARATGLSVMADLGADSSG